MTYEIDNALSVMLPNEETQPGVPSLASDIWGERLTCFTAAIGVWHARRQKHWWRLLVAGGPVLALQRRERYWLFEHSPFPWLPSLGLRMTGTNEWNDARHALIAEMHSEGAVIVAGDVWNLPWQRGFRRWHAPHWFVLQEDAKDLFVDEPMAMMTPEGPQSPIRVHVESATLIEHARALPPISEVFHLRELSIAGTDELVGGARYRWLERAPQHTQIWKTPLPSHRLEGSAACLALADYFETEGGNESAYEQADDLWQALRQRELAVGALEHDAEIGGDEVRLHWQEAIAEWRKVPVLLLHAKLRAGKGTSRPVAMLGAALRRVAEFEGRNLIDLEVSQRRA
ncbi:MAG: hypothetical protein ABSE51_03115 [Terracidiphilus sp.]|jgi:hypothetical protein